MADLRSDESMLGLVVCAVVLAFVTGCGDDSAVGGGAVGGGAAAGGAGSGGMSNDWEAYCADVYCPQRAQQAADTGCDPDPDCELGCQILAEACHPEIEAVQACAADAELACYDTPEGARVDLVPGECASELNALYLCDQGSCDTFDDAPCSPLACEDGTIMRFCDAGACSSDAASACDAARACTSESFVDVCPTLGCDGASQQGCLPSGFCQVSCE